VLTTLIYRSQLNSSCEPFELISLVEKAKQRNAGLNITGILLFNGAEFLQILEGKEENVVTLFQKIARASFAFRFTASKIHLPTNPGW